MSGIQPENHAEMADESSVRAAAASNRLRNWLLSGAVALVVLAVAGVSFRVIPNPAAGLMAESPVAAPAEVPAEPVIRYNAAPVIVRQTPDVAEGLIVTRLPRGSKLEGTIIADENDKPIWFKLLDGSGYVAISALSEEEPPRLARSLGDKSWRADSVIDIRKAPVSSAPVTTKTAKGSALTLVGVTAGDYIEVRTANGGIGYLAGASNLLRRMAAQPLSLSFNPSTCNFGGEVGGVFDRIGARMRAEWDAAEQKEYPTEEARNIAMAKIEGRSTYQRIERSFDGLLLTAVGQHYESQSLYFSDPPAKVIETFRAHGFKIGRDGTFPSTDLYAGIATAQGDARRYGATDLGCGV